MLRTLPQAGMRLKTSAIGIAAMGAYAAAGGSVLACFRQRYLFSLFVEQIDQPTSYIGARVQPLRYLLIFLQDLCGYEAIEHP